MSKHERPARSLVLALLSALARVLPRSPRMTVFLYHAIADDGNFFSVGKEEFERQLAHLSRTHDIVPLSRAFAHAAGNRVTRDSVALTFDDGYRDFLTDAIPLLEKYKAPATVFLLSGKPDPSDLGTDRSLLSSSEVALLPSTLVTIGSHAETHKKLAKLSYERAVREMRDSKHVIEEWIGGKVQYLAYPKGSYSAEVMQGARATGYQGAVTVVERGVTPGDDAYALPRIQIDASTAFPDFQAKLTAASDWYYALWSLARQR